MVDTGRCSICGKFKFEHRSFLTGQHRCPPGWWCWISDEGWDYEEEDGRAVYAIRAKYAAAEFIERWDNGGDYVCIGGDEMEVSVKPLGGGDVQVFKVTGEMVPEYWAEEVR